MSTSDTQAEGDGFIFRFGTHPEHLVAPQERMLVSEIKKIIAQHVQGFDPASDLVLEVQATSRTANWRTRMKSTLWMCRTFTALPMSETYGLLSTATRRSFTRENFV